MLDISEEKNTPDSPLQPAVVPEPKPEKIKKKRIRKTKKEIELEKKEVQKNLEKVQEEDEDMEYVPTEKQSSSRKKKEKIADDSEHLTDAFMSDGGSNAEKGNSNNSVEFEEDLEGSELRQGD